MTVKAYMFDVFGTCVDWRTGVANVARLWFEKKGLGLDPLTFADEWRFEYQPSMEKVRSGKRGFVPLEILHLENLRTVLERHSILDELSNEELLELNNAWEQLPAWRDVVPGLVTLKNHAIIAPCSNGSLSIMTRLAKFASLPWDVILGAQIAGQYKPHPNAYLNSVKALRLEPHEVMMVAAHNSDLEAAQSCGLKTAFIQRPTEYGANQTEDLQPTGHWNLEISSFGELSTLKH